MSTDLVVLNNQALALGGLGLGSKLFKLKPATLEIVQKTTRQEGAIPGKLRIRETNEHFEEMKLVMLVPPIEQREYYLKGNDFSKDAKECFSLDNVRPHERAKHPPVPFCASCPNGDKNWETYRKTKNANDLPPCRMYYHLVVADRASQMIYYFNVKGTSVSPFQQQMQNLARLIAAMEANVKAENKALKATYDKALAETPADGKQPESPVYKPMPNIFDVTFTVATKQLEQGGPWVIQCKNFVALRPEDRAEFGNLYLDFVNRRAQGSVVSQTEVEAEEAAASSAVTEAPAKTVVQEVAAVTGPISGTVVPKDEPITI